MLCLLIAVVCYSMLSVVVVSRCCGCLYVVARCSLRVVWCVLCAVCCLLLLFVVVLLPFVGVVVVCCCCFFFLLLLLLVVCC